MTKSAFREAGAEDALCIGVLATQVFLDTYATEGIRPSLAKEVLEQSSTNAISALLSDPDKTFILAEAAGHLIAFAEVTRGRVHELVPPEGTVELSRLYVQERFAAKGVGTELLRRSEAWAAAHGASTLWLTSWAGNHRARAFYEKRGYEDLGSTVYEFQGEQYENRVFAKPLRAGIAG